MSSKIYNANIGKYSLILKAIEIGKMSPIFVFCMQTEDKTSGISICALHLEQFLFAFNKFSCTSEEESDFYFESLNRRYCKQCIRHYLRKMAEFYPFTILNG